MTTPMRRQYLNLKAQHPDCILFFRLGDFYETFDEDAQIVADVCDVVLTSRPVGNNQRVPLAGVPYHSVDGYLTRLVEAGYRVAVAEQVSQPGNGLVDREVQQVVTKGTVTELAMLDESRNSYLAAVTFDSRGLCAGLAYCDVTTGEFATTQIEARQSSEATRRVGEELSRLQPREVIAADWSPQESGLDSLIENLGALLSSVDAWRVEEGTARQRLQEHLRARTLDGYGLQGRPQAMRAAAAILAYLDRMQPSVLPQLQQLQSYSLSEFMTLDEFTRRNLELTETLRSGEAKGSLLSVLDETRTPMGGRLLRRWLGRPLLNVEAILSRLDAVESFFDDEECRRELRSQLQGIGDLERWLGRVCQGRALPRDLVGCRQALDRIPRIHQILAKASSTASKGGPLYERMRASLPRCTKTLELLSSAIAEEPPATRSHTGLIRQGFNRDLDEIVEKSRDAKEWVASLEASERIRLDIKSLKVGYNKVFGYYIEITHTHRDKVPAEYIRKQTLTSAERYITPELKEYESLILNADERRLDLEQQIFDDICRQVGEVAEELGCLADGLARIDVWAGLAEVARRRRYVRPLVDDENAIEIVDGRHPVVELNSEEPFVPNDVHLVEAEAIQILTGPNMSGKSTYLRQTALIALLAQVGSFVPATRARVGLVDRIFTRIGASDEIHRGQSTFMVEMVETANILNHATGRSLLILDEIGRGTSTYDGLAIAWAVIEYIHNNPDLRAKTLFATHYHELTDLAERLPHVVNYHVAVDDSGDDVIFLRRILPGKADRSYGVHVAQMAGMPGPLVQRAGEILDDLERSGAAGPRRLIDGESRSGRRAKSMQVGLFASIHPTVEALRDLNINDLTPLEAMNRLYELQKMAADL